MKTNALNLKSSILFYTCMLRLKWKNFTQKPPIEKLIFCYNYLREDHVINRRLNNILRQYYENQYGNIDQRTAFYFRDVRVKETSEILSIKITTQRPGLLIGKAGRDYDQLKAYLTRVFSKSVTIEIIEAKYW